MQQSSEKEMEKSILNIIKSANPLTMNEVYWFFDDAMKQNDSGFRKFLPKDETGLAEAERMKTIISLMTYTERQEPHNNIRSMERLQMIADRSGQDYEAVERVFNLFMSLRFASIYMKKMRAVGRENDIPETLAGILKEVERTGVGLGIKNVRLKSLDKKIQKYKWEPKHVVKARNREPTFHDMKIIHQKQNAAFMVQQYIAARKLQPKELLIAWKNFGKKTKISRNK